MAQIIGDTWDAFPQFFLTHELRVMLSHVPNYGGNIMHALMVGHDDRRSVIWNIMRVIEVIRCAKDVCAAH